MQALTLNPGDPVAIVDDDPEDAAALSRIFQDSGFTPTTITEIDVKSNADDFLATIAGTYRMLISDHILSGRRAVRFSGAELVSRANRSTPALPAILVSSHCNTDHTGNIAYYRADIPALVDKSEYDDTILNAIDLTLAELSGQKIERERRAFVTPIQILEVFPGGEAPRARVLVVGWRSFTSVWMPLRQITEATGLTPGDLRGRWLEAKVNCYAKRADELFFRNICLAPDLPDGWMNP